MPTLKVPDGEIHYEVHGSGYPLMIFVRRRFRVQREREFVRQCKTPLLVMPGDDPPHPKVIGEEIAELAPNVEVLREWKGPEHLRTAIDRVSQFLDRHTPR